MKVILDSRIIPGVKTIELTPKDIKVMCMEFYGLKDIQGRGALKISCKRLVFAMLESGACPHTLSFYKIANLLSLKAHATVMSMQKYLPLYIGDESIFYKFIYLNIYCKTKSITPFTFKDYFLELNERIETSQSEKRATIALFREKKASVEKYHNKTFATVIQIMKRSWVQHPEIKHFLNIPQCPFDQYGYNVSKDDLLLAEQILKEFNRKLKTKINHENR